MPLSKNCICNSVFKEIEEVFELDLSSKTEKNLIKVIKSAKFETLLSS